MILTKMRDIHKHSRETYGSPRMQAALAGEGIHIGVNRVARLMRKAGLRAKTKRRFKATTQSKHDLPVAPNLPDQDFTVGSPQCRLGIGHHPYFNG